MRWRVLAGAVVLALLGAGAGYAVGVSQEKEPEPVVPAEAELTPLPADPSVPVEQIESDPDDPTLEPAIALEPALLALDDDDKGKPRYELRMPVPVGWKQNFISPGYWKYTVPGNSENSYAMRVQILASEGQTVTAARDSRIAALRSTEAQGNMSDLDVQTSDNGFVATFIDGGYRRVNIERFYAGANGLAFATVAVYGRVVDGNGLNDLIDRISIDLRTTEN